MLTSRRGTIVVAGVLLALLGLAALLNTATAGKPPPPPPPPPAAGGSICFWNDGQTSQCWAMNGDGSSKQAVTPAAVSAAIPSNVDHAGHTWWLCSQETGWSYPDGSPERELYVFRTTAQNVIESVPLTTYAGTDELNIVWKDCVSWSNDATDSFVSFVGLDTGDSTLHVYRASISFPENGSEPVLAEDPWPVVEVPFWLSFSWSPDGTRMTYVGTTGSNGIHPTVFVYDLDYPNAPPTAIYASSMVAADIAPRWSPPGVPERIALLGVTVNPDYPFDVKVVYESGVWSDWIKFPHWSPDGKYLAFQNVLGQRGKGGVAYWSNEIAIVPSQGGTKTILTANLPGGKCPLGWRSSTPRP